MVYLKKKLLDILYIKFKLSSNVLAENKQDKLGTSVTLPMQSVISSVGLFPVGTCLLGPRRGYL